MPIYEYICEQTGEVFEVIHRQDELITNWQELSDRINAPLGSIDPLSPVTKKFGGKLALIGSDVPCASEKMGIPPSACCGGGCKVSK